MTYSQLLKRVPDCIAIVLITGRNSNGIASDFVVLDSTIGKSEAIKARQYYRNKGIDACLMETYQNKSVDFVKMKDGIPIIEPLISPAENAEFFRNYFGLLSS